MTIAFLHLAAIWLIATIIGIWISYLVLKAAIRDGIEQSGLVDAINRLNKTDTANTPTWAKKPIRR
jgi:uncharacterized membrane protein YraQ (UPF0718 family)